MDKGQVKILIADDNPDILKLIDVNLKYEGYKTITARDGIEALRLAGEKNPDLIILDIIMPGMDGWQVLAHLKGKKTTEHIPVILLTGVSMKEGKERGLIEGVEDFLSKPFNPLRLLEMVEEILSQRKLIARIEDSTRRNIKIGLIGEGSLFLNFTHALLGSTTVDLIAFCDVQGTTSTSELLKEFEVIAQKDPMELLEIAELEIIIDTRPEIDPELVFEGNKKGITILTGLPVQLIWRLLEDYKTSRLKEKSLVKELNTRVKELSILNEMSQILTSPLDLWLLLEKTTILATRIGKVDACALLMYDEELEKFVVTSTLGLSNNFKNRVKLSLSDSIIEEMNALRRPLVVSRIRNWGVSPLIGEALSEGMSEMAAIPLLSKEKLIGIISVFSTESDSLSKEIINLLSILAGQAGIAIENAHLYETTRQKQRLVEQLLGKLIQAQEEERKRMAAEIHDTIAQSLVGILTKVQTCRSLVKKNPGQVESHLDELRDVVSENVREVREIIFNLRPTSLDDLGLIPSLENYIKRFERETKIHVDFLINDREKRLPTTVETAVFRIIQEALTNIKKHSEAAKVLVRLSFEAKIISLRVADNGEGFDWDEVTQLFLKGDSHGLQGMRERVSLLGGSFRVATGKGKGCTVNAQIPLVQKKESSLMETVNRILEDAG